MSFNFRVSSLETSPAKIGAAVAKLLRSAGHKIPRVARNAGQAPVIAALPRETREAQPETFFDTEFLKKLECLDLVA